MNKTFRQGLIAWAAIFICALIAQLWLGYQPAVDTRIPESRLNLVKNAALPIFLSENRVAATRQLESLIQESDIREIRVYSADQRQIAAAINSKVPANDSGTSLVESFPITFQGSLAGSIQVEIAGPAPASRFQVLPALLTSLVVASLALGLFALYLFSQTHPWRRSRWKADQPEILESLPEGTIDISGSSLLLYVYPLAEAALLANPAAHRDALTSLYRRLENHVQLYGGRVLSLSDQRFVCRMPSGQSTNDSLQALIFTWGVAKPMSFRYQNQQYRLDVKSLLHKTQVAARQGTLFAALAEVDAATEQAVIESRHPAHISQTIRDTLAPGTEIDTQRADKATGLWAITGIPRSLEALWRKQEASALSR